MNEIIFLINYLHAKITAKKSCKIVEAQMSIEIERFNFEIEAYTYPADIKRFLPKLNLTLHKYVTFKEL